MSIFDWLFKRDLAEHVEVKTYLTNSEYRTLVEYMESHGLLNTAVAARAAMLEGCGMAPALEALEAPAEFPDQPRKCQVMTFVSSEDAERLPEGKKNRASVLSAVAELALENIANGTLEYQNYLSGRRTETVRIAITQTHHEILKRLAKQKKLTLACVLASAIQSGLHNDYY